MWSIKPSIYFINKTSAPRDGLNIAFMIHSVLFIFFRLVIGKLSKTYLNQNLVSLVNLLSSSMISCVIFIIQIYFYTYRQQSKCWQRQKQYINNDYQDNNYQLLSVLNNHLLTIRCFDVMNIVNTVEEKLSRWFYRMQDVYHRLLEYRFYFNRMVQYLENCLKNLSGKLSLTKWLFHILIKLVQISKIGALCHQMLNKSEKTRLMVIENNKDILFSIVTEKNEV